MKWHFGLFVRQNRLLRAWELWWAWLKMYHFADKIIDNNQSTLA